MSSNFDFTQFLANPSVIQNWLSHSLPHDTTSIESAVLVHNTHKWPFLIDPQRQALKWISEMEKANGVTIVKSADSNCLTLIEEAVQLGKAVVITVSLSGLFLFHPSFKRLQSHYRGSIRPF